MVKEAPKLHGDHAVFVFSQRTNSEFIATFNWKPVFISSRKTAQLSEPIGGFSIY